MAIGFAQRPITKYMVSKKLADVLNQAAALNLTDGPHDRVSLARGVDGWIVRDPDNVAYSFLPVSKGLGKTKTEAWRLLHVIQEVMFAVAVRHPEIVKEATK